MNKAVPLLSALCLAAFGAQAQNLLLNGDFELPGDDTPATDWAAWSWGNGWANTEQASWGSGSYHLAVGAAGGGGGGYYQTVPASSGISYTLTVDSGADAWWLPTGTMIMFFLDASDAELGQVSRNTVDPAVYGEDQFDVPHPWETYSLAGTTPAGTAKIKVELTANNATGSVGFDNAFLVIPEPAVVRVNLEMPMPACHSPVRPHGGSGCVQSGTGCLDFE